MSSRSPPAPQRPRLSHLPQQPRQPQQPHEPHEPIARALQGNEMLTSLMQRLKMSRARLQAIAPLLPDGLQGAVQAGPLDDKAWSLLVPNAAAAAKLRQMLPQLQAALLAQGFSEVAIRLKVQGRRP